MRWMSLLLLCLALAGRADWIPAAVQWPGWTIETDEAEVDARYPLTNLLDGSARTAWVFNTAVHDGEGPWRAPFRHGVGHSLRFVRDDDAPVTIDGIALINGYGKDAAAYRRNNRVRKIEVVLHARGTLRYTFDLDATRALQRRTFPAAAVTGVTVLVLAVDAGADDDLCLSELALLHDGRRLPWRVTPTVLANASNMSCCGGTDFTLRTRNWQRLPSPHGNPVAFVAAARQPGSSTVLLCAAHHWYLYDLAAGAYRDHRAFAGQLSSWGMGWTGPHTALLAFDPAPNDWQHRRWYRLTVGRHIILRRTDLPARTDPAFLPGARGPYYPA